MKKILLLSWALLLTITPAALASDQTPVAPVNWHPQSLLSAIGSVLIFAAIGIAAAILGFKIFDKCTPGHLESEILEHRNIAAAIVAAAVIIGVSIIIAASIQG